MKLLVIGHTVEDHFHHMGKDTIKPGGIYYTASALRSFTGDDDMIFLNTSVEKKNEKLFADVYADLDKKYFRETEAIPKVYLMLHDYKERGERYENITKTLDVSTEDLDQFDGILINMITGFDITVEKAEEIRRNFSGPVYLDVHTLARGLDENLKRDFRLVPEVRRWLASVDFVQVNESELRTLSGLNDENEIAEEVLSTGLKYLLLTKGEKGVRIYWTEKGEMKSLFMSAKKVRSANKIGCGDVFGAVFFYTYIKTKNIKIALEFANSAGGITASGSSIDSLRNLKKDVFTRYY